MPAKAALEPIFIESRNRWRVDVPASKTTSGKRVRAHFKTRQGARDYITKLDGPNPASAIDPRLAADADTARQRAQSAGLDLTLAEIVAGYVEAVNALGGSGSLLEAATAFRQHHEARVSSKPLQEATEAFFTAKDGTLRPRTEGSYRYTLEKVLGPLAATSVADITAEDLTDLLIERKPTSRAVHVRNLRVFWSWASKEPRTWATMAPVDSLEFRKDAPEADVAILRPDDVKALLKAAEGYSANAAVAYAVAIFAGVRQAELARLTWGDIGEEHIEIGASVAKKAKRRLIPISSALRAWLDAYMPKDGDKADFIVGANWARVSCAVRRLAGWDVVALILDNPPEPTRGGWPANGCRHTCASVLVATGEPLETLIFQFGHSGGHDLLRRHYVGRLTKKDALATLATGPHGKKLSTIQAA